MHIDLLVCICVKWGTKKKRNIVCVFACLCILCVFFFIVCILCVCFCMRVDGMCWRWQDRAWKAAERVKKMLFSL